MLRRIVLRRLEPYRKEPTPGAGKPDSLILQREIPEIRTFWTCKENHKYGKG